MSNHPTNSDRDHGEQDEEVRRMFAEVIISARQHAEIGRSSMPIDIDDACALVKLADYGLRRLRQAGKK